MTHEMVKRVARAIAEPKQRYVIKCKQNDCGEVAQWQLWFIDGALETWISSFGKYDCDHTKAEYICEQMNNELIARLAIAVMRDLYKCIPGPLGNSSNDVILNGTIDIILKE